MPHMGTKTLPKSLREARERANITQDDLAEAIGLTRAAICHWEVGRAVPSGAARILLGQVLGVSVADVDGWFVRREEAA